MTTIMNDVNFETDFEGGNIFGSTKGFLKVKHSRARRGRTEALKLGGWSVLTETGMTYKNGKWCDEIDDFRSTHVTWSCGPEFKVIRWLIVLYNL